ncbi:MAG: hypothetical protein J4432_05385 [DPANN group archaeon]|nr:hypothetical protein [DPANN group archaeon]
MALKMNDPLVRDFIVANAGDDSYKVMRSLAKGGLTDEGISKLTKFDVNRIRAALNKLHYLGIIIYTKEKATDSNWYTYTWYVKKERALELLNERYQEKLRGLEKQLDFEESYVFFKCSRGCEKLPFELAFEYDFKCSECGSVMDQMDNKKEKQGIQKQIKQINDFLKGS